MEYKNLGNSGLKVSRICLGSMQFGWTTDEKTAYEILDEFYERGGNFIDTANIYSTWAPGNPGGVAEEIIGNWMKSKKNRRFMVIATKVRGRMWPGPNGEGLSRKHIIHAVEDSLKRLKTDYIDLYQLHWPDETTPLEETLKALDDLVRQGKVLYLGVSNFPAWFLTYSLWISEKYHLSKFISVQPHYNLVHRREFEEEVLQVVEKFGLGVIPYSPLAGGFLTGKYKPDKPLPPTPRARGVMEKYFNERCFNILTEVIKLSEKYGKKPSQIALRWLLEKPFITSPIIGANNVEQLSENVNVFNFKMEEDDIKHLDKISDWKDM